MPIGFVYVLVSPNAAQVKIGGSDYLPAKRIREINATEPYRSLGPWTLYDFRQVEDWRAIEGNLHYSFRSCLEKSISGQMELFNISPYEAASQLRNLDLNMLVDKPKVDRLFNDATFAAYLMELFKTTGLLHWLDMQGIWTLSLFPNTSGGRYFTLNIGSHEVAFGPMNRRGAEQLHFLYMDRLLLDFDDSLVWIQEHDGMICPERYNTAWGHSMSVEFCGDFDEAFEFLHKTGVRRAIIAYWTERLIALSAEEKLSSFARWHNYNAVAEIKDRMTRTEI